MDSNDSLNVISKLNLQQVEEPIVEETQDDSEKAEIAKKANAQEAINTTDDNTSDKVEGIGKLFTDWWWVLVGLYFFRGIFSSGS